MEAMNRISCCYSSKWFGNNILLETKTLGGYGVLLEVSEELSDVQLTDIASQIIQS